MNDTPKKPRSAAALSAGILLIFFGLVFLLGRLGVIDARSVWRQWPLIVLAVGVLHLWRTDWLDLGGHAMVATGFAFELGQLTGKDFKVLWPVVIIWLGLVFVGRALKGRDAN